MQFFFEEEEGTEKEFMLQQGNTYLRTKKYI